MPWPLTGVIKPYDWGSRTAIHDFLGRPPGGEPAAELWFGAHPGGPATCLVDGAEVPLDALVGTRPELLGAGRSELPYLVKVLAADKALSLQVHPNRAQARAGFAAAQADPVAALTYLDTNAKPEIVVALTGFRALSGLRPIAESLRIVAALGVDEMVLACRPLCRSGGDGAAELAEVLHAVFRMPPVVREQVVAAVVRRANDLAGDADALIRRYADLVAVLAKDHPGDLGIVVALFLNDVELAPGEALFQPAGVIHAYVRGVCVEVMGNSDNVLRGGLTGKWVDVDGLLDVLDARPAQPVRPVMSDGAVFRAPDGEFCVRRIGCSGDAGFVPVDAVGPAILLCVDGDVTVSSDGACSLHRGGAAFVPAGGSAVSVSGNGDVFAVCCG